MPKYRRAKVKNRWGKKILEKMLPNNNVVYYCWTLSLLVQNRRTLRFYEEKMKIRILESMILSQGAGLDARDLRSIIMDHKEEREVRRILQFSREPSPADAARARALLESLAERRLELKIPSQKQALDQVDDINRSLKNAKFLLRLEGTPEAGYKFSQPVLPLPEEFLVGR
jgi:hypothetical protein